MAFEWLVEKANDAIQAVSEAGSSLLETASSLATQAQKALVDTAGPAGTEAATMAGQLAEKALADAASASLAGDRKGLSPEALSSAKMTVNAVSLIAEAFGGGGVGTAIAGAAGAVGAAGALRKVGENIWESQDEKVKVAKVEDVSALYDDFAALWWDYDTRKGSGGRCAERAGKPASTERGSGRCDRPKGAAISAEAVRWLVDDSLVQPETGLEQTHSRMDASGSRTDVSLQPGRINVTKTDDRGRVITEVEKTPEKTRVQHNGETAIVENGQTVFQGRGFKVVVDGQGKRQIQLPGEKVLVRNADGSASIIDHKNKLQYSISNERLRASLETGQPLVFASGSDDLDTLTEQIRQSLKPGQTGILVMNGLGSRTVFHDGTVMDVRSDKTALIKTPEGDTILLDATGKVFILKGGCRVALTRENLPAYMQFRDGKYYVGGIAIDTSAVQLTAANLVVDVAHGEQRFTGGQGASSTITTDSQGQTTVTTGGTELSTRPGSSLVSIRTPGEEEIKVDIKSGRIETSLFVDTPDRTVVKETGTVIHANGTVEFEDGRGPVVRRDGSVKVDDHTSIGADMSVRSGDWQSSAHSQVEQKATSVVAGVHAQVGQVLGKTAVRWADVLELNTALGEVTSLMGSIPPHSKAFAKLMQAYGLLILAIQHATPKAEETVREEKADEEMLRRTDELHALVRRQRPNDKVMAGVL